MLTLLKAALARGENVLEKDARADALALSPTYLLVALELVAPPLVPVETPAEVPEVDFVLSAPLDPESPSARTEPEPLAVPLAPIAPLPLVEPEA